MPWGNTLRTRVCAGSVGGVIKSEEAALANLLPPLPSEVRCVMVKKAAGKKKGELESPTPRIYPQQN